MNIKRKKCLIIAYIYGNLGDDLFIKILCERYKDVLFFVVGMKKYRKYFKEISNLKYISSDTFIVRCCNKVNNVIRMIMKKYPTAVNEFLQNVIKMRTKYIVMIGGSMFMQSSGWKKQLLYQEEIFDNNTYILGCNFGPFYEEEYRRAYEKLFEKVSDVCMRDKYSKQLFENLDNVRWAPDIVLNFDTTHSNTEGGYYLISIIDPKKEKQIENCRENYIEGITKIIEYYLKRDENIILMSFCEAEGDKKIAQEIMEKTGESSRVKLYNYYNMNHALEVIKNSKGIIATRFHAMILAFLLEKWVLPIIYNEKTMNVLNDFSFEGVFFDINKMSEYSYDEILNNIKQPSWKIETKKAEEHFINLDKILK